MTISDYIDVIALFVASISVILSVIFGILQQQHNKNSVRPFASICFSDFEDYMEVTIKNSGTGPMVIKEVKVKNESKEEEANDLISLMPPINQLWSNYETEFKNMVLACNDSLTMLALIPNNEEIKNKVRKALSPLTISIEYEDVYGTLFHAQRDCGFFGRFKG